jgi:ABC-type transporter Mla subunit MlaD
MNGKRIEALLGIMFYLGLIVLLVLAIWYGPIT